MKSKKQWIRIVGIRATLALLLIGTVTAYGQQRDAGNFPDSSDKPPKGASCDDGKVGDKVHCTCDSDDDKACSDWFDSNCDRYDEGGWVCKVKR